MKKKTKFKELSKAYKISIIAIITVFVINILSFLFVMLPMYSLVGDSTMTDIEKDNKFEKLETSSDVVLGLTVALFTVSVVSGGYGLYQDVRKKPKK